MLWSNEARVPQLLKPTRLETVLHKREATVRSSPPATVTTCPGSQQLQKAHAKQEGPPKINKIGSLIF